MIAARSSNCTYQSPVSATEGVAALVFMVLSLELFKHSALKMSNLTGICAASKIANSKSHRLTGPRKFREPILRHNHLPRADLVEVAFLLLTHDNSWVENLYHVRLITLSLCLVAQIFMGFLVVEYGRG